MTRILVVEDEPSLRELLAAVIEEMNHNVFQAPNGREALKVIEEVKPALVISDVMMPVMDGYTLLSEIKHRPEWSGIRVMLISAANINKSRVPAADAYASKPYDLDVLESMIKQLT